MSRSEIKKCKARIAQLEDSISLLNKQFMLLVLDCGSKVIPSNKPSVMQIAGNVVTEEDCTLCQVDVSRIGKRRTSYELRTFMVMKKAQVAKKLTDSRKKLSEEQTQLQLLVGNNGEPTGPSRAELAKIKKKSEATKPILSEDCSTLPGDFDVATTIAAELSGLSIEDVESLASNEFISTNITNFVDSMISMQNLCMSHMNGPDVDFLVDSLRDPNNAERLKSFKIVTIIQGLVTLHRIDALIFCQTPITEEEWIENTNLCRKFDFILSAFLGVVCPILTEFVKNDSTPSAKLTDELDRYIRDIDTLLSVVRGTEIGKTQQQTSLLSKVYQLLGNAIKAMLVKTWQCISALLLVFMAGSQLPWKEYKKASELVETLNELRGKKGNVAEESLYIAASALYRFGQYVNPSNIIESVRGFASSSLQLLPTVDSVWHFGSSIASVIQDSLHITISTICSQILEKIGLPTFIVKAAATSVTFAFIVYALWRKPKFMSILSKNNGKLEIDQLRADQYYATVSKAIGNIQKISTGEIKKSQMQHPARSRRERRKESERSEKEKEKEEEEEIKRLAKEADDEREREVQEIVERRRRERTSESKRTKRTIKQEEEEEEEEPKTKRNEGKEEEEEEEEPLLRKRNKGMDAIGDEYENEMLRNITREVTVNDIKEIIDDQKIKSGLEILEISVEATKVIFDGFFKHEIGEKVIKRLFSSSDQQYRNHLIRKFKVLDIVDTLITIHEAVTYLVESEKGYIFAELDDFLAVTLHFEENNARIFKSIAIVLLKLADNDDKNLEEDLKKLGEDIKITKLVCGTIIEAGKRQAGKVYKVTRFLKNALVRISRIGILKWLYTIAKLVIGLIALIGGSWATDENATGLMNLYVSTFAGNANITMNLPDIWWQGIGIPRPSELANVQTGVLHYVNPLTWVYNIMYYVGLSQGVEPIYTVDPTSLVSVVDIVSGSDIVPTHYTLSIALQRNLIYGVTTVWGFVAHSYKTFFSNISHWTGGTLGALLARLGFSANVILALVAFVGIAKLATWYYSIDVDLSSFLKHAKNQSQKAATTALEFVNRNTTFHDLLHDEIDKLRRQIEK